MKQSTPNQNALSGAMPMRDLRLQESWQSAWEDSKHRIYLYAKFRRLPGIVFSWKARGMLSNIQDVDDLLQSAWEHIAQRNIAFDVEHMDSFQFFQRAIDHVAKGEREKAKTIAKNEFLQASNEGTAEFQGENDLISPSDCPEVSLMTHDFINYATRRKRILGTIASLHFAGISGTSELAIRLSRSEKWVYNHKQELLAALRDYLDAKHP